MTDNCRVCGSVITSDPISLRETMFGWALSFSYQLCDDCGCLQIAELPAKIENYYPLDYYSYRNDHPSKFAKTKDIVRAWLSRYGPAWLFSGQEWSIYGARKSLRDADVLPSESILDLGCGSGGFIATLRNIGFRHVLGADPFIDDDFMHANGVRVLKRSSSEIDQEFDVLMMHHSLEHVWDQQGLARDIARILKPSGRCIIRIPTIDSWAWTEYGLDWVQLDAPRHFYLHSRKSIVGLLESAGLIVTRVVDDSSSLQILGSEKVRRGYPLIDGPSKSTRFEDVLPSELIASSARCAKYLNSIHRGDSITVHARKRPERAG